MAREQVFETGSEVVVIIEIPGVEKEDIRLNVSESGIEVSVEKGAEKKVEKRGLLSYESRYYGYRRYFPLPLGADPSGAKAAYHNGLLEVRIPKPKKAKGFAVPVE